MPLDLWTRQIAQEQFLALVCGHHTHMPSAPISSAGWKSPETYTASTGSCTWTQALPFVLFLEHKFKPTFTTAWCKQRALPGLYPYSPSQLPTAPTWGRKVLHGICRLDFSGHSVGQTRISSMCWSFCGTTLPSAVPPLPWQPRQ